MLGIDQFDNLIIIYTNRNYQEMPEHIRTAHNRKLFIFKMQKYPIVLFVWLN